MLTMFVFVFFFNLFCSLPASNQPLLRSGHSSSRCDESHHRSSPISVHARRPSSTSSYQAFPCPPYRWPSSHSEPVVLPLFPQLSMDVQFSLAHHILAMVKAERNRQVLCEGGLVATLLTHCRRVLLAPEHPLHLPITRVLEKLCSQAITHEDLR